MPALSQLAADPKFLSLPVDDRRKIAAEVDPEFGKLPGSDQDMLLGEVAARSTRSAPNLESGLRSFLGGLGSQLAPDTGGAGLEDVKQMVGQAPPGVGTQIAIGAARTIPPIVGGAVAGFPGALMGGAAGGTLAQEMEQAAGLRDSFSPLRLGADVLTSVIPGGKFAGVASPVARVALRAGQGAATAGVSGAVTNWTEGIPLTDGLIRNITMGLGVGGIAGLAEVRRAQALTAKTIEKADNQIAIQGPIGNAPEPVGPPVEGELLTPGLSVPAQKEAVLSFKQDVAASADALAKTDAAKAGQRLHLRLAEAFAKSTPGDEYVDFEGARLHIPSLMRAMNAEGMTPADLAVHLTQAHRNAGQGLNFLSQVQKALNQQASKDKGLQQAIDSLSDQPGPTFLGKVGRALVKMDDVRRASLVARVVTTARNVLSQGDTMAVSAVDDASEALLNGDLVGAARVPGTYAGSVGRGVAENTADVLKFFRAGDPQSLRKVSGVLDHFPEQAAELMATPAAEGALGKYTKALNVLNTFQEKFFRRVGFDTRLRLRLADAGMDVQAALANPNTIPPEMIADAVDNGLRVTYANRPQGPIGQAYINMFHNPIARPLMTTANPFPRFMVNAYTFLLDHSPAGYLRIMGLTNNPELYNGTNPRLTQRTLARAQTGTFLLAGALALRNNPETRSEKYYKIKVNGKDYDTRPFAPLPQMLFIAEGIRQMLRDGHLTFTTPDQIQGLLSMNRIAGTGLVAADLLKTGSMDQKARFFGDMISQYVGGFTVPAGALGDLLAARDPNEGIYRDTRTDQYTKDIGGLPISAAPAIRNIPKAVGSPFGLPTSQDLPMAVSALRPGPLRAEAPAFRQFTGLSVTTPTKSEDVVDRLAIESSRVVPATGVPEYDRLTAALMAPVVDKIFPTVMGDPNIRTKSAARQKYIATQVLGSIRDQARRAAAAARPDLAMQAQLKGLDTDLRNVLAEDSNTLPPNVRKVLSKAGIGAAP